ncbi:MAG: hypothetical protein KN64_13380 [Sulfurovum sp. AS07-7]|nr:MAG: hypothetical protein KN64_13380 [Sulfurovum sp. AS07-7]
MEDEVLNEFGEMFIKRARDGAIREINWIINGSIKAPSLLELSKQVQLFSDDQKDTLRKVVIEAIDTALFKVITILEEHEEYIKMTITKDGKTFNLAEISDGLGGQLSMWIEEFSEYEESL